MLQFIQATRGATGMRIMFGIALGVGMAFAASQVMSPDTIWIDSQGSIYIKEGGLHRIACATEGAGIWGKITTEVDVRTPVNIECADGHIEVTPAS